LYATKPLQYWMKIDDEAKAAFEALDEQSTEQTLSQLTDKIHRLYLASLCPHSHNEFGGFFGHIELTYTMPVQRMTRYIVRQKKYDRTFREAMTDQLINLAFRIGHNNGRDENLA